ncbi:MAG: type I-E CRISPR-associated protein Cas5/CasD [Lachnospiraceae bacterium]|jgi:CRISPR system Cascade subunit CasD|nr:type I-E CRISPR-associated protein Cas5/CasD [Lachnospiraceae bacterium]
MKTILLKFSGPLQSWGTSSHFETRHTDPYPSKSAVIGMIAAAFGYRREDPVISKFNNLSFAVRTDQTGAIIRDFHIAQKAKPNGEFDRNYVTNRYYIEDGIFVTAIGSDDEEFITNIEDALKKPYFQLFLGRRSLTVNYDFIIGDTSSDVLTTIKNVSWQASDWYKKEMEKSGRRSMRLEIHCDANLVSGTSSVLRKDKVISFSEKDRRFAYREESRLFVDVPLIKAEHDAFTAIGE